MNDLKRFSDTQANDFERPYQQFLERPKSETDKNYD
jgi:hypothetical protein